MLTYHNAVSDHLVISTFPDRCVVQVYGKDHKLKWTDIQTSGKLPSLLSNCIFSSSVLISAKRNFTLAPLGSKEPQAYYNINFNDSSKTQSKDTEEFKVVYSIDNIYTSLLKSMVNVIEHTDIDLTYQYAMAKKHKEALYFYVKGSVLTVLAWKDDRFVLANRYPAENLDELFYYIMLVVEQVELSVDNLFFECISSTNFHLQYSALFANYLPPLKRCNLDSEYSLQEECSEAETLSQFFASCVL